MHAGHNIGARSGCFTQSVETVIGRKEASNYIVNEQKLAQISLTTRILVNRTIYFCKITSRNINCTLRFFDKINQGNQKSGKRTSDGLIANLQKCLLDDGNRRDSLQT